MATAREHPILREADDVRRREELTEVLRVRSTLGKPRSAGKRRSPQPQPAQEETSTMLSAGMERIEKVMEARRRRSAMEAQRAAALAVEAANAAEMQEKREQEFERRQLVVVDQAFPPN